MWEGAGWGAGQAEEHPGPRVPSPWGVKAHLPAPALREAWSSSQLPGNPTPATQVGLPPPSPAPRAPVTCPRGDVRPPARPPTRALPPASWAPAPGRQGGTRGEPELGGGAPGRASASSRLASRTQSPLCKDQPSVPGPSLVGRGPSGPAPAEQEAPWPGADGLQACLTLRGPPTCWPQSLFQKAHPDLPAPEPHPDCGSSQPTPKARSRPAVQPLERTTGQPQWHRVNTGPKAARPRAPEAQEAALTAKPRSAGPTCFLSRRPRIRARPPVKQSGTPAPGALSKDTFPET